MELVLEILKISLPALFLLIAVIIMVRGFLNNQTQAINGFLIKEAEYRKVEGERRALEIEKANKEITMPLRMHAYERMTLFCSRLELVKTILRTNIVGINARTMRNRLVANIEEEFSHNITQQMYMTDELWKIILLAKQEAVNIIRNVYKELEEKSDLKPEEIPATAYIDVLSAYLEENPQVGYLQAQVGIKKEVALLF